MKFQLLAGMVEGKENFSKTLLETLRHWSDALNYGYTGETQT